MNYRLENLDNPICGINLPIDRRGIINGRIEIFGDNYVLSLDNAREGSLSFCTMDDPINAVNNSNASVIIVDFKKRNQFRSKENQCLIFVDNVKLSFVKLLRKLVCEVKPAIVNHQLILLDAKDRHNYIGPNVIIEAGVEIGRNVKIIGNTYIYSGTKIGNNVTIKPGTVIGGQGFGHVLDGDEYLLFPQIGGVIIEDNVRIGANNCIDRGTLGDTVLGEGSKTDNLVHVGHNVVIGKNCLITAGVIFSGSVTVGDNTHMGPSTTVIQRATIGKRVCTGIGSCVIRDVKDGMLVYGVPAQDKGTASKELLEG